MLTIQQKCRALGNTECQPFSRNASCLGTQNGNRSAEMRDAWDHKTLAVLQKCRALGSHRAYHNHPCRILAACSRDEVWLKFLFLRLSESSHRSRHVPWIASSIAGRSPANAKNGQRGYDNGRRNRAPLVSWSFMRLGLGV